MAFRPRFNDSGTSRTDPLIYYTEGQSTTGNPYVTSAADKGNCTWYAWGRFWECGEPPTRPTNKLGYVNNYYTDAYLWYGNNSDGYERGSTPKLGAVICYSGGNYSGLGHVAVVEQINADGTIIVSESGWDGYRWRLRVADPNNQYPYSNPTDGYTFQGFIYNPYVNVINASPYVVSAICGNWWGESNVNPAVWEDLTVQNWTDMLCGFGLGQWTNTGSGDGMRLYNLHDWVTNNGYSDGDGDGQLNYFLHEKWWGGVPQGQLPSPRLGLNNLDEFIQSTSTSLDDLVYDFLDMWEGIAPNDYERRKNFARQCYNHILQHQNDDPSQYQWISGNRYLSESETLNNVMVIWFWFSSGEPVPPLPIIKTSFIKYINKRKFMKRRGLTWR